MIVVTTDNWTKTGRSTALRYARVHLQVTRAKSPAAPSLQEDEYLLHLHGDDGRRMRLWLNEYNVQKLIKVLQGALDDGEDLRYAIELQNACRESRALKMPARESMRRDGRA